MAIQKLYPTAYNSETGTAWTTTTVGNIDNGVATPSGTFIVAGANATSTIYYDITDPNGPLTGASYNIRYKIDSLAGDTETLYLRLLKSDLSTVLSNEMTVTTRTATVALTNSGEVAFTGLVTGATHEDWVGAVLAIRVNHNATHGADGSIWSIDEVEVIAGVNAEPTITGNTATGTTFASTDDVVIEFTGEDAENTDLQYEVNVYSANNALLESNTFGVSGWDISANASDSTAWGQSFMSVGGYLESVDFQIGANLSPTGTMYAELYAHSGTFGTSSVPTGSPLATTDSYVIEDNYGSFGNFFTFTFTGTPYSLSANTPYVVVFRGDVNESNGTDFLQIVLDDLSSGTILNGNAAYEQGSWTAQSTADLNYRLYYTRLEISGSSSTDSTFENTVTTGDTAPFNSGEKVSYTLSGGTLTADTYYWEARASDGVSWSDWTAVRDFTVNPNVAPTISATTSGGTAFGGDIVLEFIGNDADAEDLGYQVDIFLGTGTTLIDSTDLYTTASPWVISTGAAYKKAAQGFWGSGSTLDSVKFYLASVGSPTGTLYAELYEHSGTFGSTSEPTGLPLTTSDTIEATGLTASAVLYTFTFNEAYKLSAGTPYCIALVGPTGNQSNAAKLHKDVFTDYGWNPSVYDGTDWGWSSPSSTIYFELYTSRSNYIQELDSATDSGFLNTITTGDTHPFTKNEAMSLTLSGGTLSADTYYWSTRAYDEAGNYSISTPYRSITVTEGGNKTVNAGVQSTTWSAQTATTTAVQNVTVNAGVQNTTYSAQTASVKTDITVNAGVQNTTWAANATTVSTTSNVSVNAGVQNTTYAANTATVTAIQNTTVNAGVQNTTYAANAATVTAIQNVSVNAGVQNTTYTANAATVSTTTNITVNAGIQNTTYTPNAATVTAIQNVSVNAGVQNTTYTPNAATVTAIQNVNFAAGVQNTTWTANAASAGTSVNVNAGVQNTTYSAQTATVTAIQNINFAAGVQNTTWTANAPTVSTTSNVTVNAGVVNTTYTANAATVGAGAIVNAGVQNTTYAANAATVSAGATVNAGVNNTTYSAQTVSVTTTSNVTVNAGVQNTTWAANDVSVTAGGSITIAAGVQNTTYAANAVTVNTTSNVTVNAGVQNTTYVANTTTIDVASGITVNAGVQNTTWTANVPSISTSNTISAGVVNTTWAANAVSVTAGGAITVNAGVQNTIWSAQTVSVSTTSNISVNAGVQNTTYNANAATVSTSDSVTVNAGVLNTTYTLNSATISVGTGTTINAGVVNTTYTPNAVSVSTSRSVNISAGVNTTSYLARTVGVTATKNIAVSVGANNLTFTPRSVIVLIGSVPLESIYGTSRITKSASYNSAITRLQSKNSTITQGLAYISSVMGNQGTLPNVPVPENTITYSLDFSDSNNSQYQNIIN